MKFAAIIFALHCVFIIFCAARPIPYYAMDGFAYLSETIILVDEMDYRMEETKKNSNWTSHTLIIECKVEKCYKGDFQEGDELRIQYDDTFNRQLPSARFQILGKRSYEDTRLPIVPLGKSLVFLNRNQDGQLAVLTAKIVQADRVYAYRQDSNPGGLVLETQGSENIEPQQNYGEGELLKDFIIALERSKKENFQPKIVFRDFQPSIKIEYPAPPQSPDTP